MADYLTGLGSDFAGTVEGGFYLPGNALKDPCLQRVLRLMYSPDGHATRLLAYEDQGSWGHRRSAGRSDPASRGRGDQGRFGGRRRHQRLGASAVLWRYVFGHNVHWAVPSMAFIALVAVGADYNLLLAARLREECRVGLRTRGAKIGLRTRGAKIALRTSII